HAVPPDQYGKAAQVGQAVAGRTGGVREDAAGASRGAWRDAAATSGTRTEGTRPGAHRSAWEARSAPGYPRRWRRPASRASASVEPDCRYAVVANGEGRARGHRGHGG